MHLDVSLFPPEHRLKAEKIDKIKDINILIIEILKFYTCPAECEAMCCKTFDIPLCPADMVKISKISKIHKKTIAAETEPDPKYRTGIITNGTRFKNKPCPFLQSDRCSINARKPGSCSIYPFKSSDKQGVVLSIDPCFLGYDLLIDYYGFTLFTLCATPETQATAEETAKEMLINLSPMALINRRDLYNIRSFDFYGTPDELTTRLKLFLLYFHMIDPKQIKEGRDFMKAGIIEEVQKQASQ